MSIKHLIIFFLNNLIAFYSFAQAPVLTANIGHTQMIRNLAFSPDGKYLVSASDDWSIKIWDVESGKLIRTIKNTWAEYLRFSNDNKYIFSGSDDKKTMKWETQSGRLVDSLENDKFTAEGISASGGYIAPVKNGEIMLLNNKTK